VNAGTRRLWELNDRTLNYLDTSTLSKEEIERRLTVIRRLVYWSEWYAKNKRRVAQYEELLMDALPQVENFPPVHSDWKP
jgi:hypothetical protein